MHLLCVWIGFVFPGTIAVASQATSTHANYRLQQRFSSSATSFRSEDPNAPPNAPLLLRHIVCFTLIDFFGCEEETTEMSRQKTKPTAVQQHATPKVETLFPTTATWCTNNAPPVLLFSREKAA